MGHIKTEFPLISKYNEAISTVWEYYDALFAYSEFKNYRIGPDNEIFGADPKTAKVSAELEPAIPEGINVELKSGKIVMLPGLHSYEYFCKGKLVPYDKLVERVQSLSYKVIRIYRALKPELGLSYDWRHLSGACIDFSDKDGSLFDKLRKIAWTLMELRDKKQWELEVSQLERGVLQQPVNANMHKWELKEDGVYCGDDGPYELERRLVRIFGYLYRKRGKPVPWRELQREAKVKSREAVREAVAKLKKALADRFQIDRAELDKIIVGNTDKKNKITSYTFSV